MPILHRKLLSIGFSGKRSHDNLEPMKPQLLALFEAFEEAFPGTSLQLISGLADGADQIASASFIRHPHAGKPGKPKRLLGAVIPFPYPEYIKTIQDKVLFESLYNQCNYQLQLDGTHVDSAEAYRQLARILPRLCDVFLAAAGREEEGKKGGTKEAIMAALISGKPTIFLDLSDLQFHFYRNMEDWLYGPRTPLSAKEIVHCCSLLYQKDISVSEESESKDLLFFLRKRIWNQYEKLFKERTLPLAGVQSTQPVDNPLFDQIEAERKTASGSSKYFMFQYRGGYLLNYCLAIAAIFIAVNTSTVHLLELEKLFSSETARRNTLLLLGLLKVGLIVLIIFNTKRISRHLYNSRAIRFRYIAERLRIVSYFSLFGILKIPRPFVGNHVNPHMTDYPGEGLFRRCINGMMIDGGLKLTIDKEHLLHNLRFVREDWLQGQLAYYERDSRKMKTMDQQLENIPEWLSKIVLVVVIVEILETLFETTILHYPSVHHWSLWIIPVLVAFTILLPGIVTTMNSMHFQTEAKRLAFRNDIMTNQLKKILDRLKVEEEKIIHGSGANNLLNVLIILDEAASLTTDEVAEWTMIYERPVFDV